MVVNKTYALPQDYNPGVNTEANNALKTMFAAAKNDGISLFVASGFRSYSYQKGLYERYVARDGQAAADTYSARPGHSEHQTGLAFDLNQVSSAFAGTPEAIWLENNCHKYGFIIRYPKGKEAITGYQYEPWHVRYLGVQHATAVYNSGQTLEEYLGVTSVYQ
ncbi:MAG: M15 family metallopeptidase [Clostridia bacterium]|nr:M15 family metallopeptidase [Clostridia bacterium]